MGGLDGASGGRDGHDAPMSKRAKQRDQSLPSVEPSEPEASDEGGVEWPSPLRDGGWVDVDGTRWTVRGTAQTLPSKRVEHLLRSPQVRVLLCYGPEAPTEVGVDGREALWMRVRPYLRKHVVRPHGDRTEFRTGELRDDRRRSLLVVEESC